MYQRSIETLKNRLKQYKRKYYSNILLKGIIIFFSILLIALVSLVLLEYFGQFSSDIRTVLVYIFLGLGLFSLFRWVAYPVKKLYNIDKELSDEEASRQIGYFFPEIKDKLLNTIQLQNISAENNQLIQASIEQRATSLSSIPFTNAVSYKSNKKYFLRYLLIPLLILLGILLVNIDIFKESSVRLVNYKSEYRPPAPFNFEIANEKLETFRNDAFTLKVETKGEKIPGVAYIYIDGVRRKLTKKESGIFEFEFKQLSRDKSFYLEAAGIRSSDYTLEVNERASLEGLAARLDFPEYLDKSDKTVYNSGSFSVPEGTHVSWQIQTSATDKVIVDFSNDKEIKELAPTSDQKFEFDKVITSSVQYNLMMKNKHGKNKGELAYDLTVIPDKHPQVSLEKYQDTLLYNYLLIGGTISDDYGLTQLKLSYKIIREDMSADQGYDQINLPFQRNQLSQTYFYKFELDSLELDAGDRIEYYVTVWDNDGVNGAKSSRSEIMQFNIPTEEEVDKEINQNTQATNKKIEDVLNKSKEINKETEALKQKLKGKKEVEWEDKKDVKNVLDQHKKLKEEVKDVQEQYEKNRAQQDRFQQPDEELQQKMEQLDKLMKSVMNNEEMKKLMEEMDKMMDEDVDMEELQKKLDELSKKENSLSEEMDRSIELYKQLQFDQKLQQATDKFKELSKEQEKLSKENKNSNLSEEEKEEIKEKQEELNDKTESLKEKLEEMEKLNEELENKHDMDDFSEEMDQIQQEQQQSMDQMEQGKQENASDHQKKAGEKMKEMAQKMEEMAQDMETQELQENIDDLRMILENLVKMSFDQEKLMKEIRDVRQKDPRYITLSQKQLQLNDDAQIIDDSLKALAKRVFQIESFINRELDDMHKYMEGSLEELRERKTSAAAGKQQYAMTSMNNLALMLSEILEQMQNQMAQKKPGDQMCNKPGGGQPKPGQKQGDLNQMMKQLKEDQRKGRDISEQLAKMAARQEMIRRALKEMKEKAGQKEGKDGKKLRDELEELEEMMKESEKDMVNERLDERLKERQEGIRTRLLEAEKAMREQDLDDEREAKTAEEKQRENPPSYDKYIEEKEKQIELLKTIPLDLNPYYKEKVNDYFQNIEK